MYLVVPLKKNAMSGCGCGRGPSMGIDVPGALSQLASMPTVVKIAIGVAVGAVFWRLFGNRLAPMSRNMLAPWADIGPMFATSRSLGTAFGLTHLL